MIDSHAHLDMEAFASDREEVIRQARRSGVKTILSLALLDRQSSYENALALVREHPGLVSAVGCTPHDAKDLEPGEESLLERLAGDPAVLAIGEVGLDYHHRLSPPETQRQVFRRQIRVARKLGLPLIVHHREAEQDLLQILDEEGACELGGVIHSFTGDAELARACLDRGFHISFSGILTFKRAGPLREVASQIPADRLLVETDCPYLAPEPHRGTRSEPAHVWSTARTLARIRGVSVEEIERVTTENFHRLFAC